MTGKKITISNLNDEKMEHLVAMAAIPREIIFELCDFGKCNDIITGYVGLLMKSNGLEYDEIEKNMVKMRNIFDSFSASDADDFFHEIIGKDYTFGN